MRLFSEGEDLFLAFSGGHLCIGDAPIAVALGAPPSMATLLADVDRGLDALRQLAEKAEGGHCPLHEVAETWRPGPVYGRPGKIICVGLNYRAHARETGGQAPAEPVLFSKFSNTLAGHRQTVDISGLTRVDYEAELGVMIGRRTRGVKPENALDQVLGYFNANDLSDRRLQFASGQWLLGKTPDGFLPTGPYLVVPDDGFDPQHLAIRGWLNGELRQDSNTADMIFTVAELVAYASRYMTLEPGDLLVTGTPAGVILGREERQWMRPGDEYTVEIEGLGQLTTPLTGTERNVAPRA